MALSKPIQQLKQFLPAKIWKESLVGVAAFIAYLLLAEAGSALQYTEFRSSPWNPAAAVSVAAGLRFRWWSAPIVFVAYLLHEVTTPPHFGFLVVLSLALAHVSAFTIGPAIVVRFLADELDISAKNVVLAIVVIIAFALMAAAIRMLVLENAFDLPFGATLRTSFGQAVGNIVGILTITPTLYAVRRSTLLWVPWTVGDAVNIICILIAVYFVFGLESTDEFKFFYLLFLPVIAFALRRGFVGAAVSTLATNLAMLVLLVLRSFEPPVISELQIVMTTLSFAGLTLGAAISERIRVAAYLHESQLALLRASRLSLAGEMASALSHELNQPLSAVRSYVRSAMRRLQAVSSADNEAVGELQHAVKAIDDMAKTMKSVRRFVRHGIESFDDIDVRDWMKECAKLLDADLRKAGIRLDTHFAVGVSGMFGNQVQLQQVLVNLIRNSREASTPDKQVTRIIVAASSHHRPGFVEIVVSDNGPGLPSHVRDSLFSPLVSSKAEGLGLGLSLCKTILRSHGGDIWLVRSDKNGTEFAFTVPARPTSEERLN